MSHPKRLSRIDTMQQLHWYGAHYNSAKCFYISTIAVVYLSVSFEDPMMASLSHYSKILSAWNRMDTMKKCRESDIEPGCIAITSLRSAVLLSMISSVSCPSTSQTPLNMSFTSIIGWRAVSALVWESDSVRDLASLFSPGIMSSVELGSARQTGWSPVVVKNPVGNSVQ